MKYCGGGGACQGGAGRLRVERRGEEGTDPPPPSLSLLTQPRWTV